MEVRLDGAHKAGRPHFRRFKRPARVASPGDAQLGLRWPPEVLRVHELAGPALLNVVHRVVFSRSLSVVPTIAVISARPGCGCTTIAMALAHAASEMGEYSVLVDLAFERPRLAQQLGLHVDDGIDWAVERAAGQARKPLWKPLLFDRRRRVGLLTPTLTGCRRTYRAAAIGEISRLLRDLAPHVALAIVDIGACSASELPVERLPITNAVLVHRADDPHRKELDRLDRQLRSAGVVIEAVMETFAADIATATGRPAHAVS